MKTRALALAAAGIAACTPALDWRDVRPVEGMVLQFPCRPSVQKRVVALSGLPVTLALHACAAAGQTWGLAAADVGDPARVPAALTELRTSAALNIDAKAGEPLPLPAGGAVVAGDGVRLRLAGHLPDATAVEMQLAVFAYGTQVFQASALGGRLDGEAADYFFASIRRRR